MLAQQNSGIKEAYKELKSLENDDERRAVYEAREKAIMDYRVQQKAAKMEGREEGIKEGKEKGIKEGIEKGIKEGIKEGIEKEKLRTAINMLKSGMSMELISTVTDLPIERIEELQKEV